MVYQYFLHIFFCIVLMDTHLCFLGWKGWPGCRGEEQILYIKTYAFVLVVATYCIVLTLLSSWSGCWWAAWFPRNPREHWNEGAEGEQGNSVVWGQALSHWYWAINIDLEITRTLGTSHVIAQQHCSNSWAHASSPLVCSLALSP